MVNLNHIIGYILIGLIFLGIPNYWDFFCSSHFLQYKLFSICSMANIIEGILMFSVFVFVFYIKYSLKTILFILLILEIVLSIILCINLDISYTTAYLGEIIGILIAYISFFIIDKQSKLLNIKKMYNFNKINILYVLLIINGIYTGYISGIFSGVVFVILSILIFILTLLSRRV